MTLLEAAVDSAGRHVRKRDGKWPRSVVAALPAGRSLGYDGRRSVNQGNATLGALLLAAGIAIDIVFKEQ